MNSKSNSRAMVITLIYQNKEYDNNTSTQGTIVARESEEEGIFDVTIKQ